MIKCSGNRISPTEIEEVVFKTGLIKEVAAIGVEDFAAGQVVKVFVVPVESKPQDQHAKLIDDIIDYCANQMPGYMVPRKVEILDTMPKTAVGKTDYPKLKQENN
jgi:acyl-coenzyme A synthetase/AMP-(fatty) acid ligase